MDTASYINKTLNDPEVESLFDLLGEHSLDEFGELKIYDFVENGVAIYFDSSWKIRSIFLYAEGRDGRRQSILPLPHKLEFSDKVEDIEEKIGKPQASGQNKTGRIWHRFDYGSHSVHLEFEGMRISLARVMVSV